MSDLTNAVQIVFVPTTLAILGGALNLTRTVQIVFVPTTLAILGGAHNLTRTIVSEFGL